MKSDNKQNINDLNYIKRLFEIYGIKKYINLSDKYYDSFIDRIIYDYRVFDKISYSVSKFAIINNYYLKYVIVIFGAILSWIKSIKYRNKNKISTKIIALPYADKVVRFMRIQEISDTNLEIVYHPIFHFENFSNHYNLFKLHNKNIYLESFSLTSILRALLIVIRNCKRLKNCSDQLDKHFGSNTCKLPFILVYSILYRDFIRDFVNNKIENEKTLWLLDYDFDLKYIIFNDIIHKFRPKDITIHLQHGSFFNYEESYCNPVSDLSLCCSERERGIIESHNSYNSDIYPLGAPLQTFIDDNKIFNENNAIYDILVLLTSTYDCNNKEKQINLLKVLNQTNYKYLVRYRPASRNRDEEYLGSYIGKGILSKDTSLLEDINKSKVIISFSEDALYTAIRNNKKILLFSREEPEKTYNLKFESNNMKILFTVDNLSINELEKMIMTYNNVSYTNDSFVLYNFGVNDFKLLKQRFNSILSKLI